MCSDGLLIFVIRVIIAELLVVVDADRVHVGTKGFLPDLILDEILIHKFCSHCSTQWQMEKVN